MQARGVQEVGVLVFREGGVYGRELGFEFGDAALDEVIGGDCGFDGYDAVCEKDAGDWFVCFLGHFLTGGEEGVECLGQDGFEVCGAGGRWSERGVVTFQ